MKQKQTKCYCGHTTYCDCGPEELEILEVPMPIEKNKIMGILKKIKNELNECYEYYDRFWFGGLLEPIIIWFTIFLIFLI